MSKAMIRTKNSNNGLKIVFLSIFILVLIIGFSDQIKVFGILKENFLSFAESIYDFRAPVFHDFKDNIKIEANAQNFSLEDYFKVTDKNNFILSVDNSTFDISKTGNYQVAIFATDEYGNTSTKYTNFEVVDFNRAIKETMDTNKYNIVPKSAQMIAATYSNNDKNTKPNMSQVNSIAMKSQKKYETVTDPIALAALSLLGQGGSCSSIAEKAINSVGLSAWDIKRENGVINKTLFPESFFKLGNKVSLNDLKQGDILYYANGGMGISHVGIYVGNNQVVHGNYNGITKKGAVKIYGASSPVAIRLNR